MQHEPIDSDRTHLLSDALRTVTRFSSRRPRLTLSLVFILSCACVALTVCGLDFKTDRADLIDPEAEYHQRWRTYTDSFGEASDIVVVVEAKSPEIIKQVLDDLGSRMEREPEHFSHVLYKVEPGRLLAKGLQYLSPDQLADGLNRLDEFLPVSQGRWDLIQVSSLVSRLHFQLSRINTLNVLSSTFGGNADAPAFPEQAQPLLRQSELLAHSLNSFLADRDEFESPWADFLPLDRRMREEANQVVYFLNGRGTMGFLKAFPTREKGEFYGPAKSLDRLRTLVAEVSRTWPSAHIGMTGIPVLENDEMRKSNADMMNASIISLLGVGLVMFVGFRGFRHPMLALIMLVAGMSWAFGYTTLSVGHLNILSISFAAILIGLGIDFAIHYLARYLELRHEGHMLRPALLETSADVGTGIMTAAVTTALAFMCAVFTRFLGVAELGIIAGGGILLCAAATFIVLPALVALADQHVEPRKLPTPFQANLLRTATSHHPWLVATGSIALLVTVGRFAVDFSDGHPQLAVRYDFNLLNLQADGLESVEIQKRVFQESDDGSLLYAVSLADSPAEARRLRAEFEKLPSVHHVEELGSRLPEFPADQTQLLVQGYQAELARLPNSLPEPGPVDPAELGQALEKLLGRLAPLKSVPAAVAAARAVDNFLDAFEKLSLPQQLAFVTEYQMRMSASLLEQFRALAAAADPEPVTLADLPPGLTSRFVGPKGRWLLQVYPKDQIWDIEPLTDFVNDVRKVDPEVTGTPLQNFEASRQIMVSYRNAALYALAVICIVLLMDFLGQKQALIVTLGPLAAVGAAALITHLRGQPLNPLMLATSAMAMAIAIAAIIDFVSLRDTIFALLPPLAGGALMFGVLAFLGVDLNPANMIVLPLVLGIGVDDGVHVIHDFHAQEKTGRYRTSASTINAIMLTSLTSMIGFGSMMVAAHRGLYSLGLVLVIGVGCCLFISLVLLPALLTIVFRPPADLSATLDSPYTPRFRRKWSRQPAKATPVV